MLKGAFFSHLLQSDQHLKEIHSTANMSKNSLCYPFMQPTTFTDDKSCVFSAKKNKKTQNKNKEIQSKPSTTTPSAFSCLEIVQQPINFFTLLTSRKQTYLKLKTQKSIPVEQWYILWSKTSYKHILSLETINRITQDINKWKGILSALCNSLCKSKLNTHTHSLPCTGHAAAHR